MNIDAVGGLVKYMHCIQVSAHIHAAHTPISVAQPSGAALAARVARPRAVAALCHQPHSIHTFATLSNGDYLAQLHGLPLGWHAEAQLLHPAPNGPWKHLHGPGA